MTQAAIWSIVILAGGGGGLLLVRHWLPARWSGRVALGLLVLALLPFLLLRSGPLEVTLFRWMAMDGWPVVVAYRFDTLSQAFALLAGLLALLLLLWMGLGAPTEEGRSSPWVLFLLALFLHLLCSADLLLAYIGWELLLLMTYFLLADQRAALPTPGIAEWLLGGQHLAGYALLAALLLIGRTTGTLQYSLLAPETITPLALLLLLGTAWVRTAQVPFQGWAMATAETPGPVSTLLLGGWGLLAGPYLWLRFLSRASDPSPHQMVMIAGNLRRVGLSLQADVTIGLREVAMIAGSVSLIVGAVLALRQERGKQVQAGDTVSRMGLLWVALGTGKPLGLAGALFLALGLLLSKFVFHLALSGDGRLERPIRRFLFLLGMWEAAGLPPSAGFVGRWLLALGLIQAGRLAYLPILLLSTPLALAYLWRGWTLVPRGRTESTPLRRGIQRTLAGCAALLPLAGLTAPWWWQLVFERVTMAVLGTAAIVPRSPLDALRQWAPAGALLLLLVVGGGVLWSGMLRRRAPAAAAAAADSAEGPLQEPLQVLPRETSWIAWVGRPTPLYRSLAHLLGRVATGGHRLVTFLERHTTFFLLVVLVAATVILIVFTR